MTGNLSWYTARAAGMVSWALVTGSVVWGLVLSTRLTRRPAARWVLDLHRFLGGLSVVFTAVHLAALVVDDYVHFGPADVLVPFASDWEPGAVALGVVGLWLLLAVEATSLLLPRLPRRVWRAVHLTAYGLFWAATLHGLTAGTDAGHPLFAFAATAAAGLVVFLTLVRVLAPRSPRSPRSPRRPGATAAAAGTG